MKREVKGAVAVAKENEDIKIAEQFQRNKSKTLRCVFGMARQIKKEKKDGVGIPRAHGRDRRLMMTPEEKNQGMEGGA